MRKAAGLATRPRYRNLKNLRGFVQGLEVQDMQFVLLAENMDSTPPMGGWYLRSSGPRPNMNWV